MNERIPGMTDMAPAGPACDAARLDISAMLDGEWPIDNTTLLDSLEHLTTCAGCAAFLRRGRDLETAIEQGLRGPVLTADDHDRLWKRVETAASGARLPERRWTARLAAGFLLAVLGTGVWWAVRPRPSTSETAAAERPGRVFVSEYSSSEGGEVSENRSAAAEFGSALAPLLPGGD